MSNETITFNSTGEVCEVVANYKNNQIRDGRLLLVRPVKKEEPTLTIRDELILFLDKAGADKHLPWAISGLCTVLEQRLKKLEGKV